MKFKMATGLLGCKAKGVVPRTGAELRQGLPGREVEGLIIAVAAFRERGSSDLVLYAFIQPEEGHITKVFFEGMELMDRIPRRVL